MKASTMMPNVVVTRGKVERKKKQSNMADGVDIDLYSDDIDQNFTQMKDGDYGGDDDLYDDVVAAPSSEPHERNDNENGSIPPTERPDGNDANGGYSHMGNTFAPNHPGRRHQLYVGNLTWWTTDQDITDAVNSVGVNDFQEVKFFENRANGQSKGFCVITLGSESGMRMCLERLPKNDLHGQKPIVTLPTKAALAQFESQQKTRPIPPTTNTSRGGQPPMQPGGGPMQGNFPQGPQGHPPRMMMPNGPSGPGGFRPQHGMPPQNMGMPPNQGPPRMQQPMMGERPMGPQGQRPQGMRYHPLLDAPKPQSIPPANQFPEQPIHSQMSGAEFEEIMTRLSDAIETLVTAISLIKQSKFAHDERFKILFSSLQDTLKDIESKSNRRSRSKERPHGSDLGPPQGHPHGHPNSGGGLQHWLQNLPDCLKKTIRGIWLIAKRLEKKTLNVLQHQK